MSVWDTASSDAFTWLEEVNGTRAVEWADTQSAATLETLAADFRFAALHRDFLQIFTRTDRLPTAIAYGECVYEYWQDDENPRGLLRRTSRENFAAGSPAWEVLIDIDRLATDSGTNWYLQFEQCRFAPSGRRLMVALTMGGTDACALREFDLESARFVPSGFSSPVRKVTYAWLSDEAVVVSIARDRDEETSTQTSRVARVWYRGESPFDGREVMRIAPTHVGCWITSAQYGAQSTVLVHDVASFASISTYHVTPDGNRVPFEWPGDSLLALLDWQLVERWALLQLKDAWNVGTEVFPADAIVSIDCDRMLQQGGRAAGAVQLVYAPARNETIPLMLGKTVVLGAAFVDVLVDATSRVYRLVPPGSDGRQWAMHTVDLPSGGHTAMPVRGNPVSSWLLVTCETLLTPPAMYELESSGRAHCVRRLPQYLDLDQFEIHQYFAVALDGVRVPYFITHRRDLPYDGSTPTVVTAYGGFQIPMTPQYNLPYIGPMPEVWLNRGGAIVVANPRGGGEYGPRWNVKREARQTVFDDLYAIFSDLFARRITSPGRLGFIGGSNGGLTAAVLWTQRPDLLNAVVAMVPITDMQRYHLLHAGAAWLDEYGHPDDPVEGPALRAYSPYHNLPPDRPLPTPLFMTSRTDDRVHPAHARKMAALMHSQNRPAFIFEATQGGHAMAVTLDDRARNSAIIVSYFLMQLADSEKAIESVSNPKETRSE